LSGTTTTSHNDFAYPENISYLPPWVQPRIW